MRTTFISLPQLTRNFLLLVTLPSGVVTVTKPVVAPLVSDGTLKAAAVPLKDTLFVHLAGSRIFMLEPSSPRIPSCGRGQPFSPRRDWWSS